MAGYVIDNLGREQTFHLGDKGLRAHILNVSPSKLVVRMQLDCDELEAALWGLENYSKPRIVAPNGVFLCNGAFKDNDTVIITKADV